MIRDASELLAKNPDLKPALDEVKVCGVARSWLLSDRLRRDNAIWATLEPLLPRRGRGGIEAGMRRDSPGRETRLNPERRHVVTEQLWEDVLILRRPPQIGVADSDGGRALRLHEQPAPPGQHPVGSGSWMQPSTWIQGSAERRPDGRPLSGNPEYLDNALPEEVCSR